MTDCDSAFRDIHAYERKVRKARAKSNADLARRLAERRPGYRLDHLVRERCVLQCTWVMRC